MEQSIVEEFIQEALSLLDSAVDQLSPGGCGKEGVNAIFRCLHTLKGSSGFLELEALSRFVHGFEDFIRDRQEQDLGLTSAEGEKVMEGLELLQKAVVEAENAMLLDTEPYRDFLQSLQRLRTGKASMAGLLALVQELKGEIGAAHEEEDAATLVPALEALQAAIAKARSRKKREVFSLDYSTLAKVVLKGRDVTQIVKCQLAALETVALAGKAAFGDLNTRMLDEGIATLAGLAEDGHFLLSWSIVEDLCGISSEVVQEAFKRLWEETILRQAELTWLPRVEAPETQMDQGSSPARGSAQAEEKSEQDEDYFRVSGKVIHAMALQVGALVECRNAMENLVQSVGSFLPSRYRRAIFDCYAGLDENTNGLERKVRCLNDRKLQDVFQRLLGLVQKLARGLSKEVDVEATGGEIEVPRSVLKTLSDPLLHLVRNSIDHGIEGAEERQRAGKPSQGRLELVARRDDDRLILAIRDDGRGLDTKRIRKKAEERGLIAVGQELDDATIHNLIFIPGFTTVDQLSEVSGRGVGMDVVRTALDSVAGHIRVESRAGSGTTITLVLPLAEGNRTRTILLITVRGQTFGVEYRRLVEVLDAEASLLHNFRERRFFDYRQSLLPFVDLAEFLFESAAGEREEEARSDCRILIVEDEQGVRLACGVGGISNKIKAVVTPFHHVFLKENPLFCGTAVVGTGEPCLILDIDGLVKQSHG